MLLEVGRVVRPHGLSGEVVVELVTNRPERLGQCSLLSASGAELRVEASRPFGTRWLIRFEGVTTIEAAEGLRGLRLLAPPLEDPEALWVHELVGSEVQSAGGERLGTVTSVISNPASDLLELDSGGLIPARFVVDSVPGRVVVELPPGLLD